MARYSLTRAIGNDATHVFGNFESMWLSLGGKIDGKLRQAATPTNARVLHTFKSPPIAEIIRPHQQIQQQCDVAAVAADARGGVV